MAAQQTLRQGLARYYHLNPDFVRDRDLQLGWLTIPWRDLQRHDIMYVVTGYSTALDDEMRLIGFLLTGLSWRRPWTYYLQSIGTVMEVWWRACRGQAVVTTVAQDYCTALLSHGVHCTLKHFPGLGRLDADTHLTSARLETPIAELAQDDWLPFQQVMQTAGRVTMLGHPILTAVDQDHPVSFSEAVVQGILRQQWQYDGVLITDDFCMGAVFESREGATGAAVKALNAGVDLILISYDGDLYYPVMAALIRAEQGDRLSQDRLAASRERLKQAIDPDTAA